MAISFYGGPVSYGLFITLTAIPVVSLVYIVFVILGFRIYQKLDGRHLISGRTSDFYFTLQNESFIPFAGIRVVFYSSFSSISGLDDSTEYEITPHNGIKKQTNLICRYRGEYEVGIKKIVVQDYLRLFSVSYRNREPMRVTVRPDIITLNALHTDDRVLSNTKDARINMTEPDVLSREYVPGDEVRRIHWRSTAAMGKLMTRESIGERQQGIGVIMSPNRISSHEEDYLPVENKMLEAVIALVLFYVGQNTPASFYGKLGGANEHEVSDMRRFDDFYAMVSDHMFDERSDSGEFYEEILHGGSVFDKKEVFLVTHTLGEAETRLSDELIKTGRAVTIYVITKQEAGTVQIPDVRGCNTVFVPSDALLTEVM